MSINDLIKQTNDPGNENATLDNLIGSLMAGQVPGTAGRHSGTGQWWQHASGSA